MCSKMQSSQENAGKSVNGVSKQVGMEIEQGDIENARDIVSVVGAKAEPLVHRSDLGALLIPIKVKRPERDILVAFRLTPDI